MENNLMTTPSNEELELIKRRKKEKTLDIIKKVVVYAFLTLVAIMSFLPFYWMIISSLKPETEFRSSVPTFFPQTFQFENYGYVMDYNSGMFGTMLINTIVVGLFSTFIGVVITIITAYAFAKMEFKGKELIFSLLLTMTFSKVSLL